MTAITCSWCHTRNDLIPFAESTCAECGHNFNLPRMECDCRLCELRREMYHSIAAALRTREYKAVFDEVWRCLAKSGGCDAKGGEEYSRVFALYDQIGMWGLLEFFILSHANTASDGKPSSPEAVARMQERHAAESPVKPHTEERP